MAVQLTLEETDAVKALPIPKPRAATVSLSRLKETARRVLPENSTLRKWILRQEDTLPFSEGIAKIELFDELLCEEYGEGCI